MMDWPQIVRALRESVGLSREGLAREVGVSLSTVYNWEEGIVHPSPLAQRQLLKVAGRWYRQRVLDKGLWQALKDAVEKAPQKGPPRRVDGRLFCARYSFAPNRLGLCGPDENRTMLDYLVEGVSDPGLASILQRFEGMYPYLKFIAEANGIADPLDPAVVEAYWVGNELLERVQLVDFYRSLEERFAKRFGRQALRRFLGKVPLGARAHHSFHVFNVPIRTGHMDVSHTLQSMDECRVSWGVVKAVEESHLVVEYRPLVLEGDRLALGQPTLKHVLRRVRGKTLLPRVQVGDTVSFHWSCVCQILTPRQAQNLEKYTLYHLNIANQRGEDV